MNRVKATSDIVRTPALIWVTGCAVGEAGGLEASAAIAAALGHTAAGAGALIWFAIAGAFEGLVLALVQWVALRRIGIAVRFAPFCLATVGAATVAFSILHAARLAWGDGAMTLGVMLAVGALAGALLGASQAIALAKLGVRPLGWILACCLGWVASTAFVTLAWAMISQIAGIGMSALAGAAVGLLGGIALGLATIKPLMEARRRMAR